MSKKNPDDKPPHGTQGGKQERKAHGESSSREADADTPSPFSYRPGIAARPLEIDRPHAPGTPPPVASQAPTARSGIDLSTARDLQSAAPLGAAGIAGAAGAAGGAAGGATPSASSAISPYGSPAGSAIAPTDGGTTADIAPAISSGVVDPVGTGATPGVTRGKYIL